MDYKFFVLVTQCLAQAAVFGVAAERMVADPTAASTPVDIAHIYVYQPRSGFGGQTGVTVFIDGVPVADLQPGEYLEWQSPPAEIAVAKFREAALKVHVEAGKTYFVSVSSRSRALSGGSPVRLVSPDEGQRGLAETHTIAVSGWITRDPSMRVAKGTTVAGDAASQIYPGVYWDLNVQRESDRVVIKGTAVLTADAVVFEIDPSYYPDSPMQGFRLPYSEIQSVEINGWRGKTFVWLRRETGRIDEIYLGGSDRIVPLAEGLRARVGGERQRPLPDALGPLIARYVSYREVIASDSDCHVNSTSFYEQKTHFPFETHEHGLLFGSGGLLPNLILYQDIADVLPLERPKLGVLPIPGVWLLPLRIKGGRCVVFDVTSDVAADAFHAHSVMTDLRSVILQHLPSPERKD